MSSSPLKVVQQPATPIRSDLSRSQEAKTPRSSVRIRQKLAEKENTKRLEDSLSQERRKIVSSGHGSAAKKPKIDSSKRAISTAKEEDDKHLNSAGHMKLVASGDDSLVISRRKQTKQNPETTTPCSVVLEDIVKSEPNIIDLSSDSEDEIPLASYPSKLSTSSKAKGLVLNRSDLAKNGKIKNSKKSKGVAKTKIGTGEKHHSSKTDTHNEYCQKCKDGDLIVCCSTCAWCYHTTCVNPPLKKIPDSTWKCPRCSVEPLSAKATKILSWRWIDDEKYRVHFNSLSVSKRKYMATPRREFFVKWQDLSYWHCSWVSEEQMEIFHVTMLRVYIKNHGLGAHNDEEEIIPGDDTDPLYERYYKYGVQPEWLQIHRIINFEYYNGPYDYLVKWRGVSYSEATWEDEENTEIPDFKMFQEIYNEWRMASIGQSIYKTPIDVTRKSQVFKYINPALTESTCDIRVKYDEQPSFIKPGLRLHRYQLDSLNWLRSSWNNGVNTILADEMGLGKTIQAITFLYSLYKEGHCTGPFIVSAPLSTIVNWEREFALWAPDLYVVTYVGTHSERFIIRQHEFSYTKTTGSGNGHKVPNKIKNALKFHVLLTSYEMVSIDLNCLSSINWSVMVIDEAHRLKNINSKFFNHLSEYNADYKLLLTGTPVQNNLVELFTLFKFLTPDNFQELDKMQEDCTDENTDKEVEVKKIQALLQQHLLRRVKDDVLQDLPAKAEFIVKVELTPMQKKYYKYILTKNFDGLNSKSGGHWATLMMVMVDLQKCCNHPYLFSTAMMEAPVLPNEIYETKAMVEASGKLGLLEKILREVKGTGHRVLIFSHFTKMLDILEDFLVGVGYDFERIDGSITGALRQNAIDRFNEPNSKSLVFLLSTKAGGLGINLATADTVILYDSDWNPHNDVQALSRAHRIGQKNKVMVYRFITRNSIEERMLQVAMKKMLLNNVVLEDAKINSNIPLSKQTLDAVIRHGTESLFREEASANNVRDNFTDEIIKDMLDRSKVDAEHKRDAGSEFLSVAKILSFTTATSTAGNNNCKIEEDNTDENFWENVVGPHCEQKPHTEVDIGDTKRVRNEINYEDFFDDEKFLKSLE